jgi:hypothetical protein
VAADPIGAVLARSKQRGTRLFVLVLIAYFADPHGEWSVNLTTLARLARLQRRRLLEILHQLTAAQELEIRSSKGRHHPSTYRLLLQETSAENRTPAPSSPVHKTAPVPPTRARNRTCSPPRPVRETAPPAPFFPPHPPLTPDSPSLPLLSSTPFPSGKGEREGGEGQNSTAIAAVETQLRTAGVALPAPSQIDRWLTLLGLGPLQTLLTRLIATGLAGKNHPGAYINTCVLDRAANPAGTPSGRPSDTAAARPRHRTLPPAMAVGADDERRDQARQLTANAEKESRRS